MLGTNIYELLGPREKKILVMRLEGKTLEEVGKEFSVTRERIRFIEGRIFTKLMRAVLFVAFENKFLTNSEENLD